MYDWWSWCICRIGLTENEAEPFILSWILSMNHGTNLLIICQEYTGVEPPDGRSWSQGNQRLPFLRSCCAINACRLSFIVSHCGCVPKMVPAFRSIYMYRSIEGKFIWVRFGVCREPSLNYWVLYIHKNMRYCWVFRQHSMLHDVSPYLLLIISCWRVSVACNPPKKGCSFQMQTLLVKSCKQHACWHYDLMLLSYSWLCVFPFNLYVWLVTLGMNLQENHEPSRLWALDAAAFAQWNRVVPSFAPDVGARHGDKRVERHGGSQVIGGWWGWNTIKVIQPVNNWLVVLRHIFQTLIIWEDDPWFQGLG
jgi:hypothetical protein